MVAPQDLNCPDIRSIWLKACRKACLWLVFSVVSPERCCQLSVRSKHHTYGYTVHVRFGCAPWQGGVFQGWEAHPATAPAGSSRSSYGGNEKAQAFVHNRTCVRYELSPMSQAAHPISREVYTVLREQNNRPCEPGTSRSRVDEVVRAALEGAALPTPGRHQTRTC